MAHNLFDGRLAISKSPAWHKLGVVFDQPLTASEAAREARLTFQVAKMKIAATEDTPFGANIVPIDGHYALLRQPVDDDPQHRFFGLVGEDYGVVQNEEIADALDILVPDWPVESAGALGYGETIFFSLDAGSSVVAGEDVHNYFFITDTRDGKTAMRFGFTPVRVVCQNTLVSGLKSASILQSMVHVGDTKKLLEQRTTLLALLAKTQANTIESFNRMAKSVLSVDDIQAVIQEAYPEPERPSKASMLDEFDESDNELLAALYSELSSAQERWLYAVNRAKQLQNQALNLLLQIDDEYPSIANTGWAVFNSVVQNEDYRDGGASMYASALFGPRARAKIRAYQGALARS